MPGGAPGTLDASWIDTSHLWIVLDRRAASPLSLPEVTRQAIEGGVDVVLCRLKDAPGAEARRVASDVRLVCEQKGVPFVMSHFPELGAQLNADAVQLGVGDPPLQQVREIVGPGMPIGYSTHSVDEAKQRFRSGAAYVFLGPIFPTPEKMKYGKPLGTEAVVASADLPGPVVFIGGIDQANAQILRKLGATRIAAITALQRITDIPGSTRLLRSSIGGEQL